MKRIGYICMAMLMAGLGGCRGTRPAGRPLVPYALLEGAALEGGIQVCHPYPLVVGDQEVPEYAREYVEYLAEAIRSPETRTAEETLQAAVKCLDAHLLREDLDVQARERLQRIRILHDYFQLAAASAQKLQGDIRRPEEMEAALGPARLLLALRRGNQELFAGWLPKALAWEAANDDWAGMAWAGLFEKQRPLLRLSDDWLVCIDAKRQSTTESWEKDGLEAWRSRSPIPIRIDRSWHSRLPDAAGPVWLLQQVKIPLQKPKGEVRMNFRAFHGQCRIIVNQKEIYYKKETSKATFSIPLPVEGGECLLVLAFDEGFPPEVPKWPVWLGVQQ